MTENWAIFLLGSILTVMTGILGMMARQLGKISDSLANYVKREDCVRAMDGHCDRLAKLESRVHDNSIDIATLKGRS